MANTTGKKYGGRQKGTPNRLTKELRSILKGVVYNELESLEENLCQLDPKQRVELIIKLMPYVAPKVKDVGHDSIVTIPEYLEEVYDELANSLYSFFGVKPKLEVEYWWNSFNNAA